MKTFLRLSFIACLISMISTQGKSQNQPYWKEGFENTTGNFTSTAPGAGAVGTYTVGEAGTWYVLGTYRTTGATGGCAAYGSTSHLRADKAYAGTAYAITPIVNNGVQEIHMSWGSASKKLSLFWTADTAATTANWTAVTTTFTKTSTTLCTDTAFIVALPTAKRIKIQGTTAATQFDIDSIWLTSVTVITPVKFGGISATEANKFVKINWNIETEINTNSYIIERSVNGEAYTKIGTLTANRAGNYNWLDNAPNNGVNYYRIRAIDNNGTYQFSSAVKINVGKVNEGLNIYPNPVKDGQVNLQLQGVKKGTYHVNVYNSLGALVHTENISSEGSSISRSITLPASVKSGNYTVEVTDGSFRNTKSIFVQ